MKSFNTKIIALSNQKGGVGKTTSAVNIAAFLAITETPTLLIDMDPQANASIGVGIDSQSKNKSIYDVLINKKNINDCIRKTEIEYLDIIPSSSNLAGAEIELVSMFTRESILKEALKNIYGKDPYIIRVGGSIPILSAFYRFLGVYTTTFSFQLNDENWHAPNEFFRLSSFYKGQEAYRQLFHKIGSLSF